MHIMQMNNSYHVQRSAACTPGPTHATRRPALVARRAPSAARATTLDNLTGVVFQPFDEVGRSWKSTVGHRAVPEGLAGGRATSRLQAACAP